MTKGQRRWALGLGTLFVLVVVGYFVVAAVVDRFLNDGGLARAIGKKTGFILKADAGYLPLFWRGLTVRSDGLLVRGKRPGGLQEIQAQNIRAACSLQAVWQRKFVIQRLTADHLEAAFGKAAAQELKPLLPREPELQPQEDTPSPLKFVISETIIRQLDLFWGDKPEAIGAIRGALVKFYPDGPDLNALATDGTLEQSGWPKLRIVRLEAHYAKPRLELRSAHFAIGKEEDMTATGFFDFLEGGGGGMQVKLEASKVPAAPFLKGFWKGKFAGQFDGETQLEQKFEPGAKASAKGSLKFLEAELHDVPTLDRVAALTRHPQFARESFRSCARRLLLDFAETERPAKASPRRPEAASRRRRGRATRERFSRAAFQTGQSDPRSARRALRLSRPRLRASRRAVRFQRLPEPIRERLFFPARGRDGVRLPAEQAFRRREPDKIFRRLNIVLEVLVLRLDVLDFRGRVSRAVAGESGVRVPDVVEQVTDRLVDRFRRRRRSERRDHEDESGEPKKLLHALDAFLARECSCGIRRLNFADAPPPLRRLRCRHESNQLSNRAAANGTGGTRAHLGPERSRGPRARDRRGRGKLSLPPLSALGPVG